MMRLFPLIFLLLAGAAQAAEFGTLQVEKSAIAFVSRQMNVPVDGVFRKFSALIVLDPARPEAGRAQIDIDLASIDAGSAEANDEVKGKSWFNVREFPKASFSSSSVRSLGGGRFETSGRMSIKGKTLEVRAPFTLRQEKGALIVDGSFPLKRLDYGIGSGIWSDTSVVADEVQIKFHFVLTPVSK
ncbi:MAG: YceI family protein [Sulfurimicrobium sp.]|nr:YceI family protein [Sulfurimicrobium sp.]MDO9190926.1 YceI family protein [Sulfurimicrobium sp.]MDP1703796.1 YceI family protein [Sulfurimicrobium sp.]MDP2198514.1 YceI family protein [Sulfurimicrobium sp.]MDP2962815.1 YceI family protein [Sulfurimicrobium sp.]